MNTPVCQNYEPVEIGVVRTHRGDAIILRGIHTNSHASYVRLVTGDYDDDVAMLSVNIPEETARLEKDEFFVDGWHENVFFLTMMLNTGLFEDTWKRVMYKHTQLEIWRFTAGKID
jgi:hypothetical protein